MKGIKGIGGIKSIRESFKTRQVKYGGYAALLTLAVIVGLLLANLLIGQFQLQADLTWSGIFSLSEQTVQVLESVNSPVRFYGLWRPGEEREEVMTVINLYLAKNRNISFEAIDPDRNPGFVMRYDRERAGIPHGSLVVEGEKGFRVINPYDMYDFTQTQQGQQRLTGYAVERRITSALLFAGTGVTPVLYEITGHDEIPLSSLGMQDFIERENYTLNSVNLLLSNVPPGAAALIINNPLKDLAPVEAEKLLGYLEKGGRLLLLADYNIRELANLNEVLASYGLRFEYGIVYETDPNYIAFSPLTEWPDLLDHDITRPIMDKSRTPVILFQPMALSTLDTKRRTVEITPLMTSSHGAFLRRDLDETSAGKVPSDISGPLVLGVAVTDPSWVQGDEIQTRIVAIGSGNLLPIAVAMGFDANRDLFMNSLVWLQNRAESISVRSKSVYLLPLRMNLVQIIIFGALFIFIIPAAFFITGFVTWLKRRHL